MTPSVSLTLLLARRLLAVSALLLLARAASADAITPPEPLSHATSGSSSALSLNIDDVIARSAEQEAQEAAKPARPRRPSVGSANGIERARAKPSSSRPKSGSMNDLLNWAIEHSDPDKLEQQAQDAEGMSVEERKAAFEAKFTKEELDRFFGSESNSMKRPIELLQNASTAAEAVTEDQIEQALIVLQEHVEDIDKAGDLNKMGGLTPLVQLLEQRAADPTLVEWCLYTLGTAAAHNPKVQQQQQQASVLEATLKVLQSAPTEPVAAKALYALSAVTGNHHTNIEALHSIGGLQVLEQLVQPGGALLESAKLQRKWVTLVHDLAEASAEWSQWLHGLLLRNSALLGKLLEGEASTDLHDKVLVLVQAMLRRAP